MEYRKCNNCGEQVHIRTKKCPFCNTVLDDENIIVENTENIENTEQEEKEKNETFENNKEEHVKEDDLEPPKPVINFAVGEDNKDYVYKAEVRHSIEYTRPMSNGLKVFITALSMVPFFGQLTGCFFGIFFITYEDNDRKSFGKSLVTLTAVMFVFYIYYIMKAFSLIQSMGLDNLVNQLK